LGSGAGRLSQKEKTDVPNNGLTALVPDYLLSVRTQLLLPNTPPNLGLPHHDYRVAVFP
jgi:hypothetical protein